MDGKQIKVFLIEDNPGDARLIKEILSEEKRIQFSLEHADRVSEGIKRIKKGGIDIILLDLSLPDSDGIDTFISIYAQATQVPIVVLSGLTDESLAMKAVQDGAQDYLIKGKVDRSILIRALRYAIERKNAELMMKSLQGKLAEANKMAAMGTLTGGVAHKINNPLTVIIGNTDLIKDMLAREGASLDIERLKKMIDRLDNASMYIKRTVEDLMIFTRDYKVEFSSVDITKLIKDVLACKDLNMENIKVEEDSALDLPMVMGNPITLNQAFLSIISNAVDAMAKGGVLKAAASKKTDSEGAEFIEVSFADTGHGISKEKLCKVFDPFFSTKDMGTGMGLSIARRIIEAHDNGSIRVESRACEGLSGAGGDEDEKENTGTTVIVRLPVVQVP